MRTHYPLIIWVNSNANHPSTWKATEVRILELCGRTQARNLATKHLPRSASSLAQTHRGKCVITCSDTVHGIRSPEAFLPRDRLFKMDWREISPSRHTCQGSKTVQTKRQLQTGSHSQNITSVLQGLRQGQLFPLHFRLNSVTDLSISTGSFTSVPCGHPDTVTKKAASWHPPTQSKNQARRGAPHKGTCAALYRTMQTTVIEESSRRMVKHRMVHAYNEIQWDL